MDPEPIAIGHTTDFHGGAVTSTGFTVAPVFFHLAPAVGCAGVSEVTEIGGCCRRWGGSNHCGSDELRVGPVGMVPADPGAAVHFQHQFLHAGDVHVHA